jgi:putative ABC transport system permease protein
MIFGTNLKEATRSLITAKQRTLLALIGIVIGIGSVIGMVSIGTIAQNQALKQFREMGIDIISVRKESAAGNMDGFKLHDIRGFKESVPFIREVAPFIVSAASYQRGDNRTVMTLMGVTEIFFDINKLRVKTGRAISDLDENRYFCVIGDDIADLLQTAGSRTVIGQYLTLGKRNFQVVGTLERVIEGGGIRPYGLNKSVIVPLATAAKNFDRPEIETFLARVDEGLSTAMIRQAVQSYFLSRYRDAGFSVQTAEEIIATMQSQMRLFTLLLGAIGSISLIVGGIGVMNVMLISVTERRREIGIRRALGAFQSDIQSQFIIESVTLCCIGGIIGIILGVSVSYIFSRINHWTFTISYPSIVMGFGVAFAVGVFFGFYPARSAAKLDPITALRS